MLRTSSCFVEINSPNSYQAFRWLCRVASLPLLIVLVILEPIVTFVLAALSLLGLSTTLFFNSLGHQTSPCGPCSHCR